jgi:ABC-type Zn uptake system ZnuABC Zn-binding protein ZnuA
MIRRLLLVAVLAILLASCAGQPVSDAGTSAPVILTSTTLLADITRNIAGDRLQVASLLPLGADAHSYQPTPQDAANISETNFIVINGAGYESFLQSLLAVGDGGEKMLVEASAGIDPRTDAEHGLDPHMWLDPNLVVTYVENIRDGLIKLDPDGEAIYKTNADAYSAQLKDLDTWIFAQVEQIPAEKRLLVTNHEAIGYFAERYGFTIVGTVVESFSSDASPSAQQLAALIDQINASGAPAIFLDASDNDMLAQQIANETGVTVVTDIHLESLTDGAPAGTYIDLMKHNVSEIVNALK